MLLGVRIALLVERLSVAAWPIGFSCVVGQARRFADEQAFHQHGNGSCRTSLSGRCLRREEFGEQREHVRAGFFVELAEAFD